MILRLIEIVFIFFSKIYIFFYKEKKDYWKMFPIIIMAGILMINIEVLLLQIFPLKHYFALFLVLPLFLFNILLRKKDYDWAVQYQISKKQRIIIAIALLFDFILVGILFNVARNNNLGIH